MNGRTSKNLILGKCGDRAGLAVYNYQTDKVQNITALPAGQDVYSVDSTDDDNLIAAGTKQGSLYWFIRQFSTVTDSYKVKKHVKCINAPVLSVCFLDQHNLAVSDTAGRCFICSPDHDQIRILDCEREIICSLFCPDDRHLAGLSVAGKLFIWDWRESAVIKKIQVPGPPEDFSVLIRAVYWSVNKLWVWPAAGGVIVLYRWEDNEVRSISVDTTDIYSIIVSYERLLTITRQKNCIDCWDINFKRPLASYTVPEGVISGCLFGQKQQQKLLLLDDRGRAGLYVFNNGSLNFVKSLQTDNICTLIGPDIEVMELAELRQKQIQAKQLSIQIRQSLQKGRLTTDIDSLHNELIELGYEHVSLALRAERYRNIKDIVSELASYQKLIPLLGDKPDVLKSSLFRYAVLLENIWQLPGSLAVYHKLLQSEPDNPDYQERLGQLNKRIDIINTDDYAIETDIPLSSLIRSCMLLNQRFTGRYLIRNIEKSLNCNVPISADELIKRFKNIIKSKHQKLSIQIEKTDMWRLKADTIEQAETIIVKDPDSELFSNIELSVMLQHLQFQSVFTASAFFNAQKGSEDISNRQQNLYLLKQLQQIEDECLFRGWLKVVYGDLRDALRQVITRAMALRNR
jgi:hypothetical protein